MDEQLLKCDIYIDILAHATTLVNLEDIMLTERSQSQKDKYHGIPLICGT